MKEILLMNDEVKKEVRFDDYVETYEKEIQSSIGFIGQDHDFFIKVKADIIKKIAKEKFGNSNDIRILDIGCGIGLIDYRIASEFKNLYGVDVEEGVIEKAKEHNPLVKYSLYDGIKLPFEDNSMDMVFTVNVMHHVPPDKWETFAKEMFRVTKKGGISAVFEHNPMNPLTRLAVSRCEFDRDAVLLSSRKLKSLFDSSGFSKKKTSYILFFPFRSELFRKIENAVRWIPFGAQHLIIGEK